MKLITKDTDQAIKALCYLAERPAGVISVADLARQAAIPRPFLRKILQQLSKDKLLCSYKGRGGGFELAKRAAKIKLTEVVKVFQEPIPLVDCLTRGKPCPDIKICRLRNKLQEISQLVAKEFAGISIADLLDQKQEGKNG